MSIAGVRRPERAHLLTHTHSHALLFAQEEGRGKKASKLTRAMVVVNVDGPPPAPDGGAEDAAEGPGSTKPSGTLPLQKWVDESSRGHLHLSSDVYVSHLLVGPLRSSSPNRLSISGEQSPW